MLPEVILPIFAEVPDVIFPTETFPREADVFAALIYVPPVAKFRLPPTVTSEVVVTVVVENAPAESGPVIVPEDAFIVEKVVPLI
jgi:hypothetical protein